MFEGTMQLTLVFTALLAGLINVEAAFQNYTAAVLEFGQPSIEITNDTIEDNIDIYRQFLRIAMKQEVKIIVFPEYGLTNGPVKYPSKFGIEVPDLKTPLPYKHFFMEKLSDMAKEHKIYMVVNLIEHYKGKYYKTDVVFDKTGVIVAKYQAVNIGNKSPGITRGPVNQPDSVFDTDFGVKFGLLSGYDIPANISTIPRLANVSDIIITTSRTSYLPFQHSLSLQLGFAMANKVNVLAASLSRPDEGISGSGIYGADGTAYSMFIAGKPSTKQLVGKLAANQVHIVTPMSPFTPQSLGAARPDAVPEITKFTATRSFSDKVYKTLPLDLSNPNIKSQVCHGKFCCNFEVNVTTYNKNDHYRFLAFQGSDKLGETVERLKICGVVACESDDASSCATRNTTTAVIFDGISVQYEESGSYVGWAQPVLLNKDLVAVTNSTFNVNFVNGKKNVVLSTKEQANVVLFGIMASGVDSLCFSLILTVMMSSVCTLLR